MLSSAGESKAKKANNLTDGTDTLQQQSAVLAYPPNTHTHIDTGCV